MLRDCDLGRSDLDDGQEGLEETIAPPKPDSTESVKKDQLMQFIPGTKGHQELMGSAVKLTRNPAEAEDLVQSTLVKALENLNLYEANTNMRAWLMRMMKNLFINKFTHDKMVKRTLTKRGVELPLESPDVASPEDQIIAREQCRRTETLPAESQTALLEIAQGKTYEEVAKILKIPRGTVMSRLCRARRAMG